MKQISSGVWNPTLNGIQEHLDFYMGAFDDLRKNSLKYMIEDEAKVIEETIEKYKEHGFPAELAKHVASLSTIFSAMDLAEVANESGQNLKTVGNHKFENEKNTFKSNYWKRKKNDLET